MRIILLGAPGSGKGTLAKQISRDFNIPQISTGDLFRAMVKEESELGQKVKSIMECGGLVPDEITIQMVKNRIEKEDCKKGFILDGFPRTIEQAKALENITPIENVILVELSNEKIIQRLSARRTCKGCGEIYSTMNYKDCKCAKCGSDLIQRDDDKAETIKHRLEVYDNYATPLINFYSDRLLKVSSDCSPEDTYRPVKTFLENLGEGNE